MDVRNISIRKQLGSWQPNAYLSNLCMSYFEEPNYASRRLFPVCLVNLPSGFYYEFSKADLARDNVRKKPDFGAVAPAVLGFTENSYSCHVNQVILGTDKIIASAYQASSPAVDPNRLKVKTVSEQIALHYEIEFAKSFFKAGAWTNTWEGASSANASQKKFVKFSDPKSDPLGFVDSLMTEIRRTGRRRPNRIAVGMKTFVALKNHSSIVDKIKYSGTSANPAVVTEQVLAQIFGVESFVVCDATFNAAPVGQSEDMNFVCDETGLLILYSPDAAAIDEVSAGYCFAWSEIGSSAGDYIAIDTFEPQDGSHTEFMEAVFAFDMRKTADCLGAFATGCA